jgi:hypothetical protein
MRELSTLTTCVDRIVFGRTYGAVTWLEGAYHEVCEREDWLSESEGRRLGLDDVLKIGSARAQLRYTGEFRSDLTDDRASIVKTIFGEALDPSTQPLGHACQVAGPPLHVPPPSLVSTFPPALKVSDQVMTNSSSSTTSQTSPTILVRTAQQPRAAHSQKVNQNGTLLEDEDPPFCAPVPDGIQREIARLLSEIPKSEDHQAESRVLLEDLETKLNPEINRLTLQYKESPSYIRQQILHSVVEQLDDPRRVLVEAERHTVKLHRDLSDQLFRDFVSLKTKTISPFIRQRLLDVLHLLSQAKQVFSDAQAVAAALATKAHVRSANETHWTSIHAHTPTDEVVQALETAKRQSAFTSEQNSRATRELEVAETKLAFANSHFAELLNTLIKESADEAGAGTGDVRDNTSMIIATSTTY